MIGLDTNVLVRYLTQDHPAQSKRATAIIEAAAAKGQQPIFVSKVVLCEVAWVLSRAYGVSKTDLLEVLEKMLATQQLDFEDRDQVKAAVTDFRDAAGDLADYVIGRGNQGRGCRETVTFDQALRGHDAFRVLKAS